MKFWLPMLIVGLLVADANAGWLFGRRARCSSVACQTASIATTTAVHKETAVQKDEAIPTNATQKSDAVQKTEAVQKDDAVQKDEAVQKGEPTTVATNAVVVTQGSPIYALALRKARIQAARGGRCFHPGGGFGGCHAEGVGSGSTASAALSACCFTGQRRCAAAAVVRGTNGRFYACKIFW